jgi:hypothetical protein
VVVAVFQQGRFNTGGSADNGFATSHDGGRTWTAGSLPQLTAAVGGAFERASDPVVTIGPDAAVYAQSLLISSSSCRSAVGVQRSDDRGLTWSAPVLVQDDAACALFNDKNWMAVDTFPGSPHHGRIYSAWDRIDSSTSTAPLLLRYSDDRGATWSSLVTVSPPEPSFGTLDALPMVQPNGDLTIVYLQTSAAPFRILAQTSHDGGNAFSQPVTVSDDQGAGVPGMRTGVLPAAAADPVTGKLYVVWQDARANSDGRNDIVLSMSADGGGSWGPLTTVNRPDTARLRNRFTPAVAAYAGAILVAYGSREDDDARVFMRYAVSTDEGGTFGREHRLGGPGRLEFAAMASGLLFLGDYIGLTLSSSTAHAVWCRPTRPRRGRTGPHQTAWSATIRR